LNKYRLLAQEFQISGGDSEMDDAVASSQFPGFIDCKPPRSLVGCVGEGEI
jgi:hypothetical protein